MGLAETASAGEFERAKEIYIQVLQDQPTQDIQVQVWQELPRLPPNKRPPKIFYRRAKHLQMSIDDEALRSEAHTSIARALAHWERLDEAIAECEMNLSTLEAQLQCAMILEMAGDQRAIERYKMVANNELRRYFRSESLLCGQVGIRHRTYQTV